MLINPKWIRVHVGYGLAAIILDGKQAIQKWKCFIREFSGKILIENELSKNTKKGREKSLKKIRKTKRHKIVKRQKSKRGGGTEKERNSTKKEQIPLLASSKFLYTICDFHTIENGD